MNDTFSQLNTALLTYIRHIHQGFYNELYFAGRVTGLRPGWKTPTLEGQVAYLEVTALSQLCLFKNILTTDLSVDMDTFETEYQTAENHTYVVPDSHFNAEKYFLSALYHYQTDFLAFGLKYFSHLLDL